MTDRGPGLEHRLRAWRRAVPALLLLLAGTPAFAQPSVTLDSFQFDPADGARTYMDAGGTWDGTAEATNTTGDTFRLSVTNTAAGDPGDPQLDAAFDIDLSLELPAGFRLPTPGSFPVSVTATGGDTNCVAPGGGSITASQSGSTVDFQIPADTDLPAQGGGATSCTYEFEFGLTTDDAAPFAAAGNQPLDYDFAYNEVDDDAGTEQTEGGQHTVEVRRGDVIVTKTAEPNDANPDNDGYADGETAEWTVSVFNNGDGGTFAVLVTDTLNTHFDPATLQLTPQANAQPGTPLPVPQGDNQYTITYIEPGEQADITVEAEVAVGATGGSCPDLRNDVAVEDRLGNTSSSFGSVELDLRDPLLDYDPPDFTINFGTPTTVSFDVTNVGEGSARSIELEVTNPVGMNGLAGVTISNVSTEWIYDAPSGTFIYVGPDGATGTGDETLAAGAVSTLQFDAEMNQCDGPTDGFLTWNSNYENICGTAFSYPNPDSNYDVVGFPDLGVNKTVSNTASNFGQSETYTIELNGQNIAELPEADPVDNNNDWSVTDTVPADEFGNGIIPAVPAGTIITVGGSTYNDTDTDIPVAGGDTITWAGDQDDLEGGLPSITINFDLTCPAADPVTPVTVSNTATLEYSACSINQGATAQMTVNESPIDDAAQNFALTGAGPFETGRPDTNLTAGDEPNEGERLTFAATYDFPAGYPGQWSGSGFAAEMGTGSGGLAGEPLQLAFGDNNGNDVADAGDTSGVIVEVINPNGSNFGPVNLDVGTGADEVTINPGGDIEVADLSFIATALGTDDMAEMTLNITYHATAPEGNLDANGQPTDDVNRGIFDERVTLTVENNPLSCANDTDFTQGTTGALQRATVSVNGSIDAANDAGACGATEANIEVTAPDAGTFSADNIRVLLESTDYELPDVAGDITIGPPLNGLNPEITFPTPGEQVQIHVTPNDGDNLTDVSSITFDVDLRGSAAGREMQASVFYDSNHTSPDIGNGWDDDEDYPDPLFPTTITGPTVDADLDVEFFPPFVTLGDPDRFEDVDGNPGDEGVFDWRVRLTNTGTTTLTDYVFTNEVPPGFLPYRDGSSPVADAGSLSDPVMVWSSLPDIPPGGSVEVVVAIGLEQNGGCNVSNPNETIIYSSCTDGTALFNENGPAINFPVIDLQLEHQADSFCELCRDGYVDLQVRNEGASDLYDITVNEDLSGSGLEYAGTTEVFSEGGGSYTLTPDPNAAGDTTLSWDSASISELGQLYSDLSGTLPTDVTIRFHVRSSDANPEALVNATREITGTADFNLFCGDPGLPAEQEIFTVPLRQPEPQVDKQGRNRSARQGPADYADPVFGGTDDVVIWRVNSANSGAMSSADLEDLLVNDTVTPGSNFTLQFICPNETAVDAQAASMESGSTSVVAPCIAYTTPFDVDDPFGNPPDDEPGAFIDAPRGGDANVYYLGTVQNQCTNETNDSDIQWGCEVETPAGGINADGSDGALSAGFPAGSDDDTAELSTGVDPNGVVVDQTFTGTNPAQPLGTKGILTITVTNNSGGTVRNLQLTDTLPADYQLDLTAPNTLDVTPAFGTDYPGIIDDYTLDASAPNQPVFDFTSSTQGTAVQSNLLRNGDELVLTLGVIRVRPFDDVNDPEVREEQPAILSSDPDYTSPDDNIVSLQFENTCGTVFDDTDSASLPDSLSVDIDPEDIDVDVNPADPNLFYILSDPTATIDFNVVVTNRGGHEAADYATYVTVGDGIDPITVPAGCSSVSPPPELGEPPDNPSGIMPPIYDPAESQTFLCLDDDPLQPSVSNTFAFTVQRDLGGSGDLTFRADSLGEITADDGSAPPDVGAAGYPYYSKDNVLARIIGFNLSKELSGACSEGATTPDPAVQVGEECSIQVIAEWFGFATPGFGNIEIQNPRIYEGARSNNPPSVEADPATDPPNLPDMLDGQGIVSLDFSGSSSGVTVDEQNPPTLSPVQETAIAWRLDTITAPADLGSEQTFVANLVTRTLNDPENSSAAPNEHNASRFDEVNARFDVFFTSTGDRVTFDEVSDGYPPASLREERVIVAEPNVTITKEVCNESISVANNPANSGPDCQPFVSLPDVANGDSDDEFIFRLTVANEDAADGLARAPAFDIAIEDETDPSDQLLPVDFAADGLDNDGDGSVDEADEGSISDSTLNNGAPAVVSFDGSHSSALAQIDAGDSVELLYRAQLDPMVTPTQQLTNTVGGPTGDGNNASGVYDSLEGASGNQSADVGTSGTLDGAREYQMAEAQATIEVDDITVNPGSKSFPEASRTDDPTPFNGSQLETDTCLATAGAGCINREVVVGEEVLVQLEFTLPLSELRDFTVVDNLPAGMQCVEALDVTLPAYPADSDPGFDPGGTFSESGGEIACGADQVSWDFGTHTLQGSGGTDQYQMQVQFIARVDNDSVIQDGVAVDNGGSSTVVQVSYTNASGNNVDIEIEEATLTPREPQVALQKFFGFPKTEDGDPPPNLVNDITGADEGDIITVEVHAQNTGTSPAYNLTVFDDLFAAGNLTYVGNVTTAAGTPVPSVTLDGDNNPTFVFAPADALPVGDVFNFSFEVQLDSPVSPEDVVANTISAVWTSLPEGSVALNSGGAIGADGDPDGMRNGQIPGDGGLNDYEATASDDADVPAVDIAKTDLDPAVIPTIGARKNYAIQLDFPESSADAVVVTDNLNSGDVSFVLENDATFDITYSCSGITSVNGTAIDCASGTVSADIEAALVGEPADEAADTVIWDFGDIVTDNENDADTNDIDPQITINYLTRVNNDTDTDDGDNLQNGADVTYTGSTGPFVDAAPAITAVEPDLTVTKSLTPPGTPPDGGDTLEYTVTIDNTGNATAFDVNIVDTLDAELEFRSTTSAELDGTSISPPFDLTPANTPDGPLIWGRDNADESVDIPAGSTFVLVYEVVLADDVEPGLPVSNSVLVDWTSLDGADADERTGAGCPATTAPDDYCSDPAVTTTATVADNNQIAKVLNDDTYPGTPDDVRVGDTVDYLLTLTIQEGTTTNVVVTDTLPAGMEFVETLSVGGATAAPYTPSAPFSYADIPAANTPTAGATGALTWTLGDIVNAADNNTANDTLTIVYQARVVEDDPPTGIAFPTAGNTTDALSNTVDLDYSLYDDSNAAGDTGNESIDVQQPLIEAANVTKQRVDNGEPELVSANQPVQFMVNVCNTGTAPAYDLVISDTLPPQLDDPSGTLPDPDVISVAVNGTDRTVDYDENGTGFSFSGGVIQWDFTGDPLDFQAPNNCIDIVYEVNVDPEVGPGEIFNNSMQVDTYFSRENDPRREYGPAGPATVEITAFTPMNMTKVGPAEATHGEIITYTLTFPEDPDGTTTLYNVEVQDDLPPGLTYIGAEPGPGNAGVGFVDNTVDGSNQVRLAFDEIPPDEQGVVNVDVRVESSVGAAGTTVTNQSSFRYTDSNDNPFSGGDDDHTFTVVIPEPLITKSELGPPADPGADGFIDLGTPEQFSLVVENDEPNSSTIWQPTILDVLPAEMRAEDPPVIDSIEVGGRTLSESGPDDYDVAYDQATGNFEVILKSQAARIDPDETLTIVYTAGLIDDTGDGLDLTNRSLVSQWYSLDTSMGVPSDAIVYSQAPGTGTTDTPDDDWAHDLPLETRAPELAVIKDVVNVTSGLTPGIAANPGDTLEYTIDIVNAGSLGTTVSLLDEIDALNDPPAFVVSPGSLTITSSIGAGWTNNTNPDGGANGSGIVDISDIDISESGGGNDSIQVVFEAELQAPLPNGKVIANQATVNAPNLSEQVSDNPNTPDPDDPTLTIIGSAPEFRFEKVSEDITDDPALLETGDTLRYTITVKNIGNADSVETTLVDQVPANATYVPDSTTLNGNVVPDPAEGVSPLEDGIPINSPDVTTEGVLTADSDEAAGNVATVVFEVTVNDGLANAAIISNQGALTGEIVQAQDGGGSDRFPFLPVFSDDPATDVVDDPTQDVVGRGVNIDAQKTVEHLDDADGDGNIDPGDTLRYTITVVNAGNVDAGTVTLIDDLPGEVTYVAGSTMLDGTVQPDSGGQSQLAAAQGGLDIPLPAGGSAVVTVDATVNAVANGTQIANQGVVDSDAQPDENTDADGNDENGDQPTVVVVGGADRLSISKEVFVVGGGVVQTGGALEYVIRVQNVGTQPVANARVIDVVPAELSLVTGSATMNGFTNGVTEGAQITANYGATYGSLAPGENFVVRFRATVDDGLALGTPISNTAEAQWGGCSTDCPTATAAVDVGGAPGVMNLNGRVWLDPDHDDSFAQGAETPFGNWVVRVYFNNADPSTADTPIDTFTSDADGVFAVNGLAPGGPYTVTFAVPDNDPDYPPESNRVLGIAASGAGSGGLMRILDIDAEAGRNLQDENLPVDPNGRIYNSVTRDVVPPGARVSLQRSESGEPVPETCFDTPAHLNSQQQQITGVNGFYRFDLNFANGSCPRGASYRVLVELPDDDGGYSESVSVVIPPETTPFDTVNCTTDAISGTPECEVQADINPPASDVPPGPGTLYYLNILFNQPERGIHNNHIAVDDIPAGLVNITKTTPLKHAVRGQLVPYAIEVENPQEFNLSGLLIRDTMPPGFKYVEGSAQRNGEPFEPQVDNRRLTWSGIGLPPGRSTEIKLLLVVGAGVGEGEYENIAQAFITGVPDPVSGQASATVRVVPDPTFDCSDVIGKVFDDKNANGYADEGEPGIAGARVATAQGLLTTTDEHGRFHITCAAIPNQDRGSNFILKLDERSLPSGYRVTTENPRVKRLTRGKVAKFNFGAAVHRVVRLDLADAAFEPDTSDIRDHWQYVIDDLFKQLRKGPSVLRISYLGDVESEKLARERLNAVKTLIEKRWKELSCCYNLQIETEVYWRRGQPLR